MMKRTALILLTLVLSASSVRKTPQQDYVDQYAAIAQSEMARTGVPASITLAQGILESDSGRSSLAVEAHNHFGIKCHNDWTGKTYFHDDETKDECFRSYVNAYDSFKDHSDFLRFNDRYRQLFDLAPDDYKSWALGLKSAGYATDPSYPSKLIGIIEAYKLYLYDYPDVSVPTPSQLESPQKASSSAKPLYKEDISFSLSREVFELNGVPFIYASEGESYESIAISYNLFRRELLRFNDLDKDAPLSFGDVVFLSLKKSQAAPGIWKHVIDSDSETLWGIAQRFGVRESSLRRMNKLSPDYIPCVGDTIILRKQ